MSGALEAVLGRHRAWSIVALVLLIALAWVWLISGAGMGMSSFASLLPPQAENSTMTEMAMPGMNMAGVEAWTLARSALIFAMWWTMMVAMMLPSAAPTILLYARNATLRNSGIRPATASFLVGYLTAWAGFSLLATSLQAVLEHARLLSAMHLASQSGLLSAALLIAVGLYQLTPIKDVCLSHCRNPAQFLSRHYRPGPVGALRMGLVHGTYCIGCCSLLMALLFVGGVMNLAWIALLTLIVASEKLLPQGRIVPVITGWLCIAGGLAIPFY